MEKNVFPKPKHTGPYKRSGISTQVRVLALPSDEYLFCIKDMFFILDKQGKLVLRMPSENEIARFQKESTQYPHSELKKDRAIYDIARRTWKLIADELGPGMPKANVHVLEKVRTHLQEVPMRSMSSFLPKSYAHVPYSNLHAFFTNTEIPLLNPSSPLPYW